MDLVGRRVTFTRFNPRMEPLLQTITGTVEWEHRDETGWYLRLDGFGHLGLDPRRPETDRVVTVHD